MERYAVLEEEDDDDYDDDDDNEDHYSYHCHSSVAIYGFHFQFIYHLSYLSCLFLYLIILYICIYDLIEKHM